MFLSNFGAPKLFRNCGSPLPFPTVAEHLLNLSAAHLRTIHESRRIHTAERSTEPTENSSVEIHLCIAEMQKKKQAFFRSSSRTQKEDLKVSVSHNFLPSKSEMNQSSNVKCGFSLCCEAFFTLAISYITKKKKHIYLYNIIYIYTLPIFTQVSLIWPICVEDRTPGSFWFTARKFELSFFRLTGFGRPDVLQENALIRKTYDRLED